MPFTEIEIPQYNKKLDGIQEKLDKVLSLLLQIQKLQAKVVKLEKEKTPCKRVWNYRIANYYIVFLLYCTVFYILLM